MQPLTRSPPKNKNYEQPPTAWRKYTTSSSRRDSSVSRPEKNQRTPRSRSNPGEDPGPRIIRLETSSPHHRRSTEFTVQHHVTRDSMLDNILLSFNHMQDGEGPYPKQPPLYSSFKDGEFTLDTPRFVYDAITHMKSHSYSSSASSSPDLKQQRSFSPYEISNTPIRRSSLAIPRNTGTFRSYPGDEAVSGSTKPNHKRPLHLQTQAASAPVSPNRSTPKKSSRNTNSMDYRGRKSRDASRSHKSIKSDPSTEPSSLPADAIILQPTKSNTPKKSNAPTLAGSPKERPGFLRRVFGSSRTQSQVRQPQSEPVFSASVSPESTPVRKPSESVPVLHKKASFFRRKKKEPYENESSIYGATRASHEVTPGSPRFIPGLAVTTDDQHDPPRWAGPGAPGDDQPFGISHNQDYEPSLSEPAKRIWIQPDEYDRVVPAPIRASNNEIIVIEDPSTRNMPAPIRSSALSQVLQSLYSSNTFINPPPQISLATGHDDPFVEGPFGTDMTTSALQFDHDDRQLARRMYDGDDDDSNQTATLLGQQTEQGERLREAYMQLFNFANINILSALRELCGRLVMRAETQQVDRILGAFSSRWWLNNPNNGFISKDVVHTICYSLFLLNTDLHIADHEKMTKNQFIKNTLPTLRGIVDGNASTDRAMKESLFTGRPSSSSAADMGESRPSLDRGFSEGRLAARSRPRPASRISSFTSPISDMLDPTINIISNGSMKTWENNLENVLRDFYTSVRQQRLPLFGALEAPMNDQSSITTHSVRSGHLQRTNSITSKELLDSGRPLPTRWNKPKAKSGSTSTGGTGRPSSEEHQPFSPNVPGNWGRSYGKTLTPKSTMSLDSNTRPKTAPQQQQSIGFASVLGQAIGSVYDGSSVDESLKLDDEVLQLAGAPWAKEGIVQHKHQLQATDKKNRDRHWTECFAVVEKGRMRLFSFTSKASVRSQRQKSTKGVKVGGGNWTESAESLENFTLIRTLADILPKGYSTGKPHAFTVTLSNGAVHVFQVGTPDIAKEFVDTINYWSARYSPRPLIGGVSSIEYGWSDSVLNSLPEPSQSRSSFQSSVRSGTEGGASHRSSSRARLPGDRLALADWTPPVPTMQSSNLPEGLQLAALNGYLGELEEEMQLHSQLRARMRSAYTPGQVSSMKALTNWDKKSAYLLGEATRVVRYIDSMNAAREEEEKVRLGRR